MKASIAWALVPLWAATIPGCAADAPDEPTAPTVDSTVVAELPRAPALEASEDQRHPELAIGRALLSRLAITTSDRELAYAASELQLLISQSHGFSCGRVEGSLTRTEPYVLGGSGKTRPFPLTEVTLAPAFEPLSRGARRVPPALSYWGGALDGQRYVSAVAPELTPGQEVCFFLTERDGRFWMTRETAVLVIRDESVRVAGLRVPVRNLNRLVASEYAGSGQAL